MTKYSQHSRNTSSQTRLNSFLELTKAVQSAKSDVIEILGDAGYNVFRNPLAPVTTNAEKVIINIFQRFHRIATIRKENRDPVFKVEDEKETQDLLHGLLQLHFDDIRKEETTETIAGGSTSIDFLLPKPMIGIEVKMGYVGNTQLRKQINDDKGCYVEHKLCKLLLVFIYDPDHKVRNPKALETQLSGKITELETKIFVLPKL